MKNMKINYAAILLIAVLLFVGCSKDFLKSYDKRIVGTWEITDVKNAGLFGSSSSLTFTSGTFTFLEDGSLEYTNSANDIYEGTWNIIKKTAEDNTVQSLQITAVNFTSQEVLSAYYDDVSFLGTDHFTASTQTTFTTYVTHFRR